MNYIIEFSDGCHGILPNDNIEYSVSRGRVILYKDGEKILDKEVLDCPSGKCEIITNNDNAPDIKAVPVDGEVINSDVDTHDHDIDKEYNIGNMLPQGMGTGVSDVLSKPLMTTESTESEDGEVITESDEIVTEGVGTVAAIGAGSIAVLWGVLGGGFFKLGEMGVDKIVQTAKRPKYRKILDAYYDYFMVNKAPKFSSLKKRKHFAKETGDERNPVAGFLKKYGAGKEMAVVDYYYGDKSVCGCYMEKKYKAAFDWFTMAINGGDVVKFDYGWTKHIQPKVFEYSKFSNYYIAYMDLMLGFTDSHFMDVIRDLKSEIKKHEKEIKELKKESVEEDNMDVSLTLTESAISYINLENNNITESAKDVVLNYKTDVNVSRKLRVLIIETALMQARLNALKNKDSKSPKVASLKRDIIANEKEKRELLENQTEEVKAAVRKIEKIAIKEAKKEVKNEKEVKTEAFVDVVPLVEEKDEDKEKEPLSIKVLKDKIALNKERLENANKEPRKHVSLINALKKENEEFKNRIALLKAKLTKKSDDEPEEDLEEPEEDVKEEIKEDESKTESMVNNYINALSSFVNEAANIDDAIKDTISLLNSKGYHTRYSSAGHYHLRKKEDKEPDGVYKGKLYSDARVQFKGTYHFGPAPKYWFWKKVDGDDYLDIVPITHNDKDGTPDEAFAKWRDNYLGTLKRWAEDLPSAKEKKEDDPTPEDKNIKEESVRINDMLDKTFDTIFRENGIRE